MPSASVPVTVVCQASTGACWAAKTTLTGAAAPARRSVRRAASVRASAPVTDASVEATLIRRSLARSTASLPAGVSVTTRSPPTTGRPAYVRWYRTCSVPSASRETSVTSSASFGPRRSRSAVAARSWLAAATAARRWAGPKDGSGRPLAARAAARGCWPAACGVAAWAGRVRARGPRARAATPVSPTNRPVDPQVFPRCARFTRWAFLCRRPGSPSAGRLDRAVRHRAEGEPAPAGRARPAVKLRSCTNLQEPQEARCRWPTRPQRAARRAPSRKKSATTAGPPSAASGRAAPNGASQNAPSTRWWGPT